ncbi:GIY-YIG nuclease family protein [uncultured Williamsia sp.]|uniref:GIY-YIG nuclease family protein n=1 Tax=uncultured Williamsia sp. TaxID=259311 RepID=UPI00261E09BB|nr:GIY-YIG nuclease family protein [uncultured Williamsia sp.]
MHGLATAAMGVDGDVAFRPSSTADIPDVGGVYVISDLRGPLYIGRTDDLNRRFHKHLEDSHNRKLRIALRNRVGNVRFAWIFADGPDQRSLEPALIRTLNPLCNDIRYALKKRS